MLAKLIAHARTRAAAIDQLDAAALELTVSGPTLKFGYDALLALRGRTALPPGAAGRCR